MTEVTDYNKYEIENKTQIKGIHSLSKNMVTVLIKFSSLNDLLNIKFLNKKFKEIVGSSKDKLYVIYKKLIKKRVQGNYIHNHFQSIIDEISHTYGNELDQGEKFELLENYFCYRLYNKPKDSYRLSCNKIFVLKEHYVHNFMRFIGTASCHLKDLNLSYNDYFSKYLVISLGNALRNNKSIKDLNLSAIQFPDDIKQIGDALRVNQTLEKLSCNDLGLKNKDETMTTLFEGLAFNKSGDWGLGIGDWAQSPIPNPQSPIPNYRKFFYQILKNY
jgi:hypothetical protein